MLNEANSIRRCIVRSSSREQVGIVQQNVQIWIHVGNDPKKWFVHCVQMMPNRSGPHAKRIGRCNLEIYPVFSWPYILFNEKYGVSVVNGKLHTIGTLHTIASSMTLVLSFSIASSSVVPRTAEAKCFKGEVSTMSRL